MVGEVWVGRLDWYGRRSMGGEIRLGGTENLKSSEVHLISTLHTQDGETLQEDVSLTLMDQS
jgi:hypothetical protein